MSHLLCFVPSYLRGALLLPTFAACALIGCGGAASTSVASPATESTAKPLVLSGRIEIDRGGIDTDALLGSSAETALSEGATPLRLVAAGAAAEGDRLGGFVNVRQDSCLVAYARGTSDVEDLDVLTFDDRGASLTADQSISPNPAVVLCPPHPDRIYVAARVASGHGLVALGVQAIDPNQAAAVAIKLGAQMSSSEGQLMTQESWPGLAKRIEQRRAELSGRWMELRRLSMPVSPRAESYVSVPLPASRCLDVLVMPNEETRGLRVDVADDNGTIITRGAERGEDRVALVCSPVETTITVGVRPRRGHGLAAVVLSRSEAGGETELAIRPDARRVGPMQPLDDVRKQVGSTLTAARYPKAKEVGRGPLEIGNTVLHSVRLNPGCTRFDVLAGTPIASIRASLWAGDALWASAEGGEQTTLYGCTSQPADVEIEVEGQGPPGQHAVEARAEVRPPAILRDHPIAAGRLLARANGGGEVVPASSMADVRVLEVDRDHRGSYPMTIAKGTCKLVIAALGPGATGVEVQAVAGNTVISKGNGGSVASVRVCADEAPLSAEIRVSVSAGKTMALAASLAR